jgi:hypothetical protein
MCSESTVHSDVGFDDSRVLDSNRDDGRQHGRDDLSLGLTKTIDGCECPELTV